MTVTYRDFRYVVPFMVQAWMYLSPVIYPVSWSRRNGSACWPLNPMAGIIDGFRSALLGTPWNLPALGMSTASAIVHR